MPQKSPSSRSLTGFLPKLIGLLILLAAAAYLGQRIMTPNVDLDKTKPVVVTQDQDGKSNDDEGSANLPAGAITAAINQKMIDEADHPFDPLLKIAKLSVEAIDENVRDYKARLASQVFADGKLQQEKFLECKIRHAHTIDGEEIPFSVYTLFLKPESNVGQEAIWVEGRNDGDLIGHATGLLNVKRFKLDPDGPIPMKGNRYPISDIGMRNLIVKMSAIGEKDRQHGECEVTIKRNVQVNGCVCTMLQAVHPYPRDHFEFHIARIYIDDSRNLPIAYEGFSWPEKPGDPPPLLEKYYYTDIQLNVGLTDLDFDPSNEKYNYPRW